MNLFLLVLGIVFLVMAFRKTGGIPVKIWPAMLAGATFVLFTGPPHAPEPGVGVCGVTSHDASRFSSKTPDTFSGSRHRSSTGRPFPMECLDGGIFDRTQDDGGRLRVPS